MHAACAAWSAPPHNATPLALRAAMQTHAFGRSGATWHSPRGGLWLTLIWPLTQPLEHYAALPLSVGVTIAGVLQRELALEAEVKWPNDLLVRDCKLAGVLCQARLELALPAILIGIGLNANFDPVADAGLALPMTTLRHVCGRDVELDGLYGALLNDLQTALQEFDAAGLAPRLAAINDRLAWRNARVSVSGPDGDELRGRIERVAVDGALQLVQDDGRAVNLLYGTVRRVEYPAC